MDCWTKRRRRLVVMKCLACTQSPRRSSQSIERNNDRSLRFEAAVVLLSKKREAAAAFHDGYGSGTKARPLLGFMGITSWLAPAS